MNTPLMTDRTNFVTEEFTTNENLNVCLLEMCAMKQYLLSHVRTVDMFSLTKMFTITTTVCVSVVDIHVC